METPRAGVEESLFDCVITSRCAVCGVVFVKQRIGDKHGCSEPEPHGPGDPPYRKDHGES